MASAWLASTRAVVRTGRRIGAVVASFFARTKWLHVEPGYSTGMGDSRVIPPVLDHFYFRFLSRDYLKVVKLEIEISAHDQNRK